MRQIITVILSQTLVRLAVALRVRIPLEVPHRVLVVVEAVAVITEVIREHLRLAQAVHRHLPQHHRPNPPPSPPPPTCPNGGQPDSSGKCPPSPPPPGPCPNGAQPDKNGKCPPLPNCKDGQGWIAGRPPPCKVPKGCFIHGMFVDGIRVVCPSHHTTVIVHNTHTTTVQQVPTNTNDINLMLVTTCTADQNNVVLNGNLAALCDSTITMMHNDGLDAQLPQVDLYLKARGLLQ
jgi:hypothetical protein